MGIVAGSVDEEVLGGAPGGRGGGPLWGAVVVSVGEGGEGVWRRMVMLNELLASRAWMTAGPMMPVALRRRKLVDGF